MPEALFALCRVLALAFALFCLFGLKPAFAPFVSLVSMACLATIFACFGRLKAGAALSWALSFCAFAFAVFRCRDSLKEKISRFFCPGVTLFILASLAMLIFLAVRQPLMSEWDEFSFWGTSQKLVRTRGQLYTFYQSSLLGRSIPPSLAVLVYLFGGLGTKFYEWTSFFAYDVLLFSCYRAFTAKFDRDRGHLAFFTFLIAFLCPYAFEIYTRIIYLEPVYMSAYADIPLGMTFAGALALFLLSDRNGRDLLPLFPALAFLTLIKDMGFALGCLAVFIVFFDMLCRGRDFRFGGLRGFWGRTAGAAAAFAPVAGAFLGWSYHLGAVIDINRFQMDGRTQVGMVQMMLDGIKELLIGPRSEKFMDISRSMVKAFFLTKISFIGSGVIICGIILFFFAVAFYFGSRRDRIRDVTLYLAFLVGFAGYYIFHLFMYVYVFGNDGYFLVSYNRYMYPYYMGWLCCAVALCGRAGAKGKKVLPGACCALFACALLLLFNRYTDYDNIFIECNDRSFAMRKNIKLKTDYIRDAVEDDDVIYIYSGGDNGERWFIYTFELIDNRIVESEGVDTEGLSPEQAKEKCRQVYRRLFYDNGVTNILIDNSSEFFIDTMGDLFDVPMGYVGLDSVAYYKVNYTDDGFYFTLVKGGKVNG